MNESLKYWSGRFGDFELNAMAAASIAIAAISIEALSALPPTSEKDVPASLRCSSLVSVALGASPAIDPSSGIEFEQRGILMLVLVVVAVFGENHGNETIRVADAVFVLVAGWSMIALFVMRSAKKTPGSTLVGALMLYIGVRITKAAINHSYEVVTFVVSSERFDTRGYGISDSVFATSLAFGGCIVACSGVTIIVNDRAIKTHGSVFTAPAIAQLAGMAFAAALIAQFSQYSRLEDLGILFSVSSCGGEGCDASFRARRLYISNSATGPLWAAVVGLTIFATPKHRRNSTPTEYYSNNPIPTAGGMVCALVTVAVVAASLYFSDNELSYVTTELLVLFLSIPTTWFLSAPLGCALFVVGNGMYVQDRLGSVWGYNLRYWTHWSLLTSGMLVSVLFVTTTITWCAFHIPLVVNERPLRCLPLELTTSALSIALFSLQLALTITTLVLFASYDGSLVVNETSWREQGFEYSIQHSLSFFFSAAFYGSRFEIVEKSTRHKDDDARLSSCFRKVWYYSVTPVTILCWMIVVVSSPEGSPYSTSTSVAPFVVGVVASAVPWMITGLCV